MRKPYISKSGIAAVLIVAAFFARVFFGAPALDAVLSRVLR